MADGIESSIEQAGTPQYVGSESVFEQGGSNQAIIAETSQSGSSVRLASLGSLPSVSDEDDSLFVAENGTPQSHITARPSTLVYAPNNTENENEPLHTYLMGIHHSGSLACRTTLGYAPNGSDDEDETSPETPNGTNLRIFYKKAEKHFNPNDAVFYLFKSATSDRLWDNAIDVEDKQHQDFLRLNHAEGYHELSSKTQIYFSTVVAKWDADFYIKVDDHVHINLSMIGSTLARHRSKPRVYMGCMKSGPVLAQKGVKYHEPEYWKFG